MTIQEKIDQLKKELSDFSGQLNKKIERLQDLIIKESDNKSEKPIIRYYPNGAYMDEPEKGKIYFYSDSDCRFGEKYGWEGDEEDLAYLADQNCFPTRLSLERNNLRKELTAKMYRDMRDERINGDWVALSEGYKYCPYMGADERLDYWSGVYPVFPHNFYFKNDTFIEDLKAMGWTEEELKIVWFGI